jgi:hypothetical protein
MPLFEEIDSKEQPTVAWFIATVVWLGDLERVHDVV